MEAKALEKARQIEGSSTNKQYIELENGDEEEAFSAVHRGNHYVIYFNKYSAKQCAMQLRWQNLSNNMSHPSKRLSICVVQKTRDSH